MSWWIFARTNIRRHWRRKFKIHSSAFANRFLWFWLWKPWLCCHQHVFCQNVSCFCIFKFGDTKHFWKNILRFCEVNNLGFSLYNSLLLTNLLISKFIAGLEKHLRCFLFILFLVMLHLEKLDHHYHFPDYFMKFHFW